jgi:uncharacterized protein YbjT (DUF2867 family)
MDARVDVFFYGSFINPAVLRRNGFAAERLERGLVPGFEIAFRPTATLDRAPGGVVYGVLCSATHDELHALYAQDWLAAYRAEAVLVHLFDGRTAPALCWIAAGPSGAPPAADYRASIAEAARAHGFPSWYVERVAGA